MSKILDILGFTLILLPLLTVSVIGFLLALLGSKMMDFSGEVAEKWYHFTRWVLNG